MNEDRKKLSNEHKKKIKDGMIKYWDLHRKECKQKNGYITISIGNKKYYKHRLVMEEYLGRKLKRNEQVHHIDGNKTNNNIENLELIEIGEHQKYHSIKNNLGKDRKGISPTNKIPNEVIEKIKKLRNEGYLIKEICEKTKVSNTTIFKYLKEVK